MRFLSVTVPKTLKVLLATALVTLCHGQHLEALSESTAYTGKSIVDHATKLMEQLSFNSAAVKLNVTTDSHGAHSIKAVGPSLAPSGSTSYAMLSFASGVPFKLLSFQDSTTAILGPFSSNPTGFRLQDATTAGYQYIIDQQNDLCLEAGSTPGTPITRSPCNGQPSQQWQYTSGLGIQNRQSGLVIDRLSNDQIVINTPSFSRSQWWIMIAINNPLTRSLGCFGDGNDRAFRRLLVISNAMTLERCALLAISQGYRYFGVENSNECYGTDSGYDHYGPSSKCNMPCTGSSSQTCGGPWALSVYEAYPQFTDYCSPDHGCLAANNQWCRQDQNLAGCLQDRLGAVAGDGRWCPNDQNYQACLNDHRGLGTRAVDGTWCRNDDNTLGCLEDHDHAPVPNESRTWTLLNDAHSCGTHYTVYRETCKGDHICSGDLAPRGQPGDTAKCHLGAAAIPFYFCYRFEQQIGGDCTVSDTQTTVKKGYDRAHFSGHNAWAD